MVFPTAGALRDRVKQVALSVSWHLFSVRALIRFFFSSHLTSDDDQQSSTAVRAKIRKLISAENPMKPLSDNQIARLLSEDGIKVARRTVAKYREVMKIVSSGERKRADRLQRRTSP